MTDRELMQQALEALENLQGLCTDADDGWVEAVTIWTPEIITALRDRLAQPEQKLVAAIRAGTEQIAALVWERDELQKKVWRYEKHGVTCQTYGHVVGACAECNTHGEAEK